MRRRKTSWATAPSAYDRQRVDRIGDMISANGRPQQPELQVAGSRSLSRKALSRRVIMVIEHVVIADLPNGEPQPPPDGFAAIVRRVDGYMTWRRILLHRANAQ